MTDAPISAVVAVHFDELGNLSYHVAGVESVRLFIVDDRAPHDRVYEWLPRCDGATIAALLGDDQIGSSQDSRHAAISARITAMQDGRPFLALATQDTGQ